MENGKITSAKATIMTFFIKDQKVFDKATGDNVSIFFLCIIFIAKRELKGIIFYAETIITRLRF